MVLAAFDECTTALCMLLRSTYLAIIFDSIKKTSIIQGVVRAVDMQCILLLLPFLLLKLLKEEVAEYNRHTL